MEKTLDLTAITKILNKSGLLDPIRDTKGKNNKLVGYKIA